MFGSKWNEITGEWRRLHKKQIYALFYAPNFIRMIKLRRLRWAGHVACMGQRRGVYRILVGKPEGRRTFGRPRHRWKDSIKMDLPEVGWGHGLDSWVFGEGRVVCCCKCGNEPSASIKCGEFLD
jgi:hypothetical protein